MKINESIKNNNDNNDYNNRPQTAPIGGRHKSNSSFVGRIKKNISNFQINENNDNNSIEYDEIYSKYLNEKNKNERLENDIL